MELKTLQELLATPDKLIDAITSEKPQCVTDDGCSRYGYEVGSRQYDPRKHDVAKKLNRPDRMIQVPSSIKDQYGEPVMQDKLVKVSRIPMPIQKHIIKQKASFAVGEVELKPNIQGSPVYDAVKTQWKRNKIRFRLKEIARLMMAETETAVIFYSDPADTADKLRIRIRVVSTSTGSELFPVFNSMEDLIAFGRKWKEGNTDRFDLYTDTTLFKYSNEGGARTLIDTVTLPYNGKMPVVYWHQDRPECDDVQELINALEETQSDYVDTNKRIGDPMLFVTGDSISMPQIGEPGKILEGDAGADAKFLSPANPTEARKLEFEMIENRIRVLTNTVNLDPQSLKGLGIESGAAMDRMLIAPHMAARDMQDGEFGEGVQRMLNFLVHVYSFVLSAKDGLEIEAVFSLFRVNSDDERVDLLLKANGNKPLMSHKQSIQKSGFSEDAEATYEEILDEAPDDVAANPPPAPGKTVPIGVAK